MSESTNKEPTIKKKGSAYLRWLASLMSIAILSAGCATTSVPFREDAPPRSETINILLSRASPQVSVIVDDRILVDARYWGTRRVNIENVPPGEYQVRVFANNWQLSGPIDYSETIEVLEGENIPIILQVPPYSTMYWIYIIGIGVASSIPIFFIY